VAPEILFGEDLYEIRSLLKEGDKYYVQPCRYATTLDDLKAHEISSVDIKSDPDFLLLKDWAKANRVSLSLRGAQ
jgi:hypothetical protein